MNKVLEFEVKYYPSANLVVVRLIRKNEGGYTSETMGIEHLNANPSWHSIEDIERKVLKAKEKLFRKYQRTKHFTLAVSMVAELASEGKMVIQDEETVDFINKFKNRVFEKTAKVFSLPRR